MSAEFKWEDPGPDDRRTKWSVIAAQLKAAPGQWALVYESLPGQTPANGITSRLRSGRAEGFSPAGSFEAVTRDGVKTYARYIGEAGEHA